MSDVSLLILLYVVGLLMLVAEIFIPSYGVLGITALGFLVAAVAKTYSLAGRDAGIMAVLACLIMLPVFSYISIKYWRRTPIGRRIVPPNPVWSSADTTTAELAALVGRRGRTVSPLRPVGICDFDGRRVSCIAEFGVIEAGVAVLGTESKGGNLAVRVETV